MDQVIYKKVVDIIVNTIGGDIKPENLTEDFKLIGNILDSMAVTNLILSLEEYFNFVFNDDELSAEAFQTVGALVELVEQKLNA
jgi:acyl carrier protein